MKVKEFKALRVKHDFSQEDCAKILKISRASFNQKETGKKDFKFDEVINLLQQWDEVDKIKELIN